MNRKNYSFSDFGADLAAGLITALVSVPISMGYALVAGLPAVYGLYGSLLPVLIFGLVSTSPRFFFSVDAAPAALTGAMIASLGIAPESSEAVRIIPLITLFTAIWLLVFWLINAGRAARFVSEPVLGGFITGIGCTIILMQLPKLYGGSSGSGEAVELIKHIVESASESFNICSLILGLGSIILIRLFMKLTPKIPVNVILMMLGIVLTAVCRIDQRFGIKVLPSVDPGMPDIKIPDILFALHYHTGQDTGTAINRMIFGSLPIAAVILAESLLSTNSFAARHDDKIDSKREILAYALGNLASSVSGACPVNGSVSRTSIAGQFGVKSQMMSVWSSIFMALILLFCTGFIKYLPVPVLTGIVIAALISILEFDLAKKLKKTDKTEYIIFYAAFFSVLLLGTIYGVIIGVALSFITYVIRASEPPRSLLGVMPDKRGFYPAIDIKYASEITHRPEKKPERSNNEKTYINKSNRVMLIEGVVIYRFTGSLFFANADYFVNDILNSINEDTLAVIVDAKGISAVDVTAAEKINSLYDKLRKRNIRFFICEQEQAVNVQLHEFAGGKLFREGVIKHHIERALDSLSIYEPYPLIPLPVNNAKDEEGTGAADPVISEELKWAFGNDAQKIINKIADEAVDTIINGEDFSPEALRTFERKRAYGYWSILDEDDFILIFEKKLEEYYAEADEEERQKLKDRLKTIEGNLHKRHQDIHNKLAKLHE
jgi:SulP family sulfate permease